MQIYSDNAMRRFGGQAGIGEAAHRVDLPIEGGGYTWAKDRRLDVADTGV